MLEPVEHDIADAENSDIAEIHKPL